MSENGEKETFKSNLTVVNSDPSMNSALVGMLRELGLNQYEAQAYLALWQGAKSAGEVAEAGRIARPRVYDVLEKLQEKGFAAVKTGRPVKYAAMPLDEAIQTLKKQKETHLFDELQKIDELNGRLGKQLGASEATTRYGIEENVWALKGRAAIYSRMAQMLERSRQHVVVCAPPDHAARKIKENLEQFQAAKGRGVKVHVVSSLGKALDKRHALYSPNSHVNQVAAGVFDRHLPTRMVLADDEALLFLTEENTPAEEEVGLWVRSPHLVSTLKEAAGPFEKTSKG